MIVTRKLLASKLTAYLRHQLSLVELVDWAEQVMLEGNFDKTDYQSLRDIVGRLGLADVKAFGLAWEDCESFLEQLGYEVKVEVKARA